MYKLIVHRDSYDKPRLWIEFKTYDGRRLSDYMSDIRDVDGINPLAYTFALEQVAADQYEPYHNMEEVANEVKLAYNYYLNKLCRNTAHNKERK